MPLTFYMQKEESNITLIKSYVSDPFSYGFIYIYIYVPQISELVSIFISPLLTHGFSAFLKLLLLVIVAMSLIMIMMNACYSFHWSCKLLGLPHITLA